MQSKTAAMLRHKGIGSCVHAEDEVRGELIAEPQAVQLYG